ncbi:MAG: ribbon-helix-helix domain-containing protein, partial [Thermosphaera sp.]
DSLTGLIMAGVISRMRLITVKMPEIYVEGLDELVKIGRYSSRSEVIRVAIRDLLKKELWISEGELS